MRWPLSPPHLMWTIGDASAVGRRQPQDHGVSEEAAALQHLGTARHQTTTRNCVRRQAALAPDRQDTEVPSRVGLLEVCLGRPPPPPPQPHEAEGLDRRPARGRAALQQLGHHRAPARACRAPLAAPPGMTMRCRTAGAGGGQSDGGRGFAGVGAIRADRRRHRRVDADHVDVDQGGWSVLLGEPARQGRVGFPAAPPRPRRRVSRPRRARPSRRRPRLRYCDGVVFRFYALHDRVVIALRVAVDRLQRDPRPSAISLPLSLRGAPFLLGARCR